jgi:hypothetical protein
LRGVEPVAREAGDDAAANVGRIETRCLVSGDLFADAATGLDCLGRGAELNLQIVDDLQESLIVGDGVRGWCAPSVRPAV